MGAALRTRARAVVARQQTRPVTLLELVAAVTDVSENEREVVATVLYLLRSGRVKLRGNFRDEPIDSFEV